MPKGNGVKRLDSSPLDYPIAVPPIKNAPTVNSSPNGFVPLFIIDFENQIKWMEKFINPNSIL